MIALQVGILILCTLVLLGFLYIGLGGRKLWGSERGVPFCGHPFELTWRIDPPPQAWTCPKCSTEFEPVGGKWRPKR